MKIRSREFVATGVLGLVLSAFASPAYADFRGEVIDGSACAPSAMLSNASGAWVGGSVSGQGQLLFGPVTATCPLIMGSHSDQNGINLNWGAANLKYVFVHFMAHQAGGQIKARICFREFLGFVNHCGPIEAATAPPTLGAVQLTLVPPALGATVYPWSGAVVIMVDPHATFTLLDVNPLWWR